MLRALNGTAPVRRVLLREVNLENRGFRVLEEERHEGRTPCEEPDDPADTPAGGGPQVPLLWLRTPPFVLVRGFPRALALARQAAAQGDADRAMDALFLEDLEGRAKALSPVVAMAWACAGEGGRCALSTLECARAARGLTRLGCGDRDAFKLFRRLGVARRTAVRARALAGFCPVVWEALEAHRVKGSHAEILEKWFLRTSRRLSPGEACALLADVIDLIERSRCTARHLATHLEQIAAGKWPEPSPKPSRPEEDRPRQPWLLKGKQVVVYHLKTSLYAPAWVLREKGREFQTLANLLLERADKVGGGGERRMGVAVLIPTYNEGATIARLIERVLLACEGRSPALRVTVLDDASPDGTAELVERRFQGDSRVEVVRRQARGGLGAAYLDGFERALESGQELIATMDADLSHEPEALPGLLERAAGHDLVIGSRYVQGGSAAGLGPARRAMSGAANLAWRLLGVGRSGIRDLTSGFRCYRAVALARVLDEGAFSRDYAFLSEVACRFVALGFRVCEVPIAFRPRQGGASKLTAHVALDSLTTLYRLWRYRHEPRSKAGPAQARQHGPVPLA